MYEYINGMITAVTPYYIVVEAGGVGYQVFVANPFRYQENKEQKVYIYQAVRDNAITLFGFVSLEEKQLFLKLLSVSGIGPKSALAILANEDHSGLITAINEDDAKFLTKFPGIGKKTAKQIILDLKGKLGDLEAQDVSGQQRLEVEADSSNPALKESLEALSALGYTKTDIKKISKQLKDFNGKTTKDYLSQALRLISGR